MAIRPLRATSTKRYNTNNDLPGSLRKQLSPNAQNAYRQAYNDAWNLYSSSLETKTKGAKAETRAQEAHEAGLKAAAPAKRSAPKPMVRQASPVKQTQRAPASSQPRAKAPLQKRVAPPIRVKASPQVPTKTAAPSKMPPARVMVRPSGTKSAPTKPAGRARR